MDEKEVLNGYVIDVAMWIGHKRVCFGIAEDQTTEYPYMMCVTNPKDICFPYAISSIVSTIIPKH